ncbi:hypothetical protein CRUP_002410 [Coryphaenoides rupestris]|nr:hypothetical protein CRUP_002410 [Coryphaenoides rupestris]
MELQNSIPDALHEFIQTFIPDADLSALDEVLLSYIIAVLEDLGSQESVEENFDIEVFTEMLEAYIPGFAEIDSPKVCEMMFNLASKLAAARSSENTAAPAKADERPSSPSVLPPDAPLSTSDSQPPGGASAKSPLAEWDEEERHLLEMFPKCGLTEARSALCIAHGDMEEAVRLIIEGDVQLSSPHLNVNHGKNTSAVGDQKMKENILEKYMLVDHEEDKKTHRPLAPREASPPNFTQKNPAPKKLVRYHGNQVVTTKGERYQMVKKEEAEEMRKTYVSIKPARKYRFH